MSLNDKINAFYKDQLDQKDCAAKTIRLLEVSGAKSQFTADELAAGAVWAFCNLNRLFLQPVSLDQTATYFQTQPRRTEEARDAVLDGISLYDDRFLVKGALARLDELIPLRAQMKDGAEFEVLFTEAARSTREGDADIALQTFLSLFDFLYTRKENYTTEQMLIYTLALMSQIGNIYWDNGEMDNARTTFRKGIRLLEDSLDDSELFKLDMHDTGAMPIFYIIEDFAAVSYALGDQPNARTYYGKIMKMDPQGHMGAELALECLDAGKTWEEYVAIADEADEGCGCGCGHDGEDGCEGCGEQDDCGHGDDGHSHENGGCGCGGDDCGSGR